MSAIIPIELGDVMLLVEVYKKADALFKCLSISGHSNYKEYGELRDALAKLNSKLAFESKHMAKEIERQVEILKLLDQ